MKFEFYGKVGLNIMSSSWSGLGLYDPDDFNSKSTVGFDLSVGFQSHFRPSDPSNFYWGAEISLTQVGGAYDAFSYHNSFYPAENLHNLGVDFGPVVGWKKPIFKGLVLDLHFSPGFLLFFKERNVEYDYDNSGGNTEWVDDGIANVYFKGGLGVWIKRFNIDLSYRYVTNIYFEDYYNSYSNVILSVGYRF